MYHFAKVYRKQKNSQPQNAKTRTVNKVDEELQPGDSLRFLQSSKIYESNYSSGEDKMVALIQNDIAKIEPLRMAIGNISTTLLVDSGSVCSILNWSVALQVVRSNPQAFWIYDNAIPKLRTFSTEPIRNEGKVQAAVSSNGWTSNSATFAVFADVLKSLIGRGSFDQIRKAKAQSFSFSNNQVNTISSFSEFKKHIALTFPNIFSLIRRSKNHLAKSKLYTNFQLRHQKVRRIPINLQYKVNKEIKKKLAEKHIIKLTDYLVKCFISPIVVRVTKNQAIKLALDSKYETKPSTKINTNCLTLIRLSDLYPNRLVFSHPNVQPNSLH